MRDLKKTIELEREQWSAAFAAGRAFTICELQHAATAAHLLARQYADDHARYVLTIRNVAPEERWDAARDALRFNAETFAIQANAAAELACGLAFAARTLRDNSPILDWMPWRSNG